MLSASGCGTVRYLIQATRGQLSLINHAKPISEVLRDETTPPRIHELLAEIPKIKAFGEESGLKPTTNYTDYVKLDRPAAVWVVSASDKLQFRSKVWNFCFFGSFPFLGWFNRDQANEFADSLRKEGLDVDVRGARAYSTLGWFRDPMLSTMIPPGDEAFGDVVNVVIHESTHATMYLKGQAYFNESLASFVADQLTPVYLARARGAGSKEQKAYEESEKSQSEAMSHLHEAYLKLAALYSSVKSEPEKIDQKSRILDDLKEKLQFRREINNATLIQFQTYHEGGKEFPALFASCQSDWKRFWGALKLLTTKSFSKENQDDLAPALDPLTRQGCPQG